MQERGALKLKLNEIDFADLDRKKKDTNKKVQIVKKSVEDLEESVVHPMLNLDCHVEPPMLLPLLLIASRPSQNYTLWPCVLSEV